MSVKRTGQLEDEVPDHTTLCRFRNRLVEDGLLEKLFAELDGQWDKAGVNRHCHSWSCHRNKTGSQLRRKHACQLRSTCGHDPSGSGGLAAQFSVSTVECGARSRAQYEGNTPTPTASVVRPLRHPTPSASGDWWPAARSRRRRVAERVGFEPTVPLQAPRISSAVLSTAQPPLRKCFGRRKRSPERGRGT